MSVAKTQLQARQGHKHQRVKGNRPSASKQTRSKRSKCVRACVFVCVCVGVRVLAWFMGIESHSFRSNDAGRHGKMRGLLLSPLIMWKTYHLIHLQSHFRAVSFLGAGVSASKPFLVPGILGTKQLSSNPRYHHHHHNFFVVFVADHVFLYRCECD